MGTGQYCVCNTAPPPPSPPCTPPSSSQSTSAVYLKANLEYIRQNYRKSMKVLASAPNRPLLTDSGECLPSLYFNNLGCIHHQMGKHSLAAHYFSKALEENDSTLNDFPPQDKGEHTHTFRTLAGISSAERTLSQLLNYVSASSAPPLPFSHASFWPPPCCAECQLPSHPAVQPRPTASLPGQASAGIRLPPGSSAGLPLQPSVVAQISGGVCGSSLCGMCVYGGGGGGGSMHEVCVSVDCGRDGLCVPSSFSLLPT